MNFLTPTNNNIRKSIRDIDDCYANDWDVLAELIQNAVDAINETKKKNGKIIIEVNCQNNSITVEDNGIGIEEEILPDLLRPFSTNKENKEGAIGEKGVGLTFAIFQTNLFTIQSGKVVGVIKDARYWKTADNGDILDLKIDESNENLQGTKLVLQRLDSNLTLFKWSKEQLKFVLRTKTAIGNTNALFEEVNPIEVKLIFTDSNGSKKTEETISYKYFLLTELLDKNKKISLSEFDEFAAAPLRTDLQKRNKLRGKVVEYFDKEKKFYALFVPKRDWRQFSLEAKIATEENLDDDDWLSQNSHTIFKNEITVSVKGMPTGVEITPNTTASAGYLPNIFVIFEDPNIKFDIGRKSLKGRTSEKFRKAAHKILLDYTKYIPKYAPAISDEEPFERQFNRAEIFKEIYEILDLKYKDIKLQKSPKSQEASVAALFYECIGNQKIKDILPLHSGSRKRYDLYALYKGSRPIIIEFKKKASDILKDFDNNKKLFDEIDCLVCWDVDETDIQMFKNREIELEEFNSQTKQPFSNATHQLEIQNVNPTYVIDLKKHLDRLETKP